MRDFSTMPTTEAIGAYRDALLRDAPAAELALLAEPLDPETVRWLDLFRASQQEALLPTVAFVRRLDGIVAAAPGPRPAEMAPATSPPRVLAPDAGSGRSETAIAAATARRSPRWQAVAWPRSVSTFAAAVLLVVLIAGAVIASFYPLRQHLANPLAMFAPARTISGPPGIMGETVLLDLTIPAFPAMHTFGGMTVTDYPAGGGSRERSHDNTTVYYIATGPVQVTAEAAPATVTIVPPGARHTDASTFLPEGQTLRLTTGTTVIASPQTVLELENTGDTPARMLGLITGSGSENTERDGTTWRWGSVGLPQDLAGAVSIQLQQLTLNPGAALPIPEESRFDYSAAVFDIERTRDLRFTGDGKWRNDSIVPLRVYLMRIFSPPNTVAALALQRAPTEGERRAQEVSFR